MRIQHNIMAMNAYRNYNANTSALSKNLEKLSSGYKINRAGDDAAGLAISEKMRAQITGLETAQKNAKDGISLVQTAEGALTEVHDMLNRMVELATQSANGTFDDTTDRLQLQKEVDELKSEIDRIADSANFNGIQLLDGSMSGAAMGSVASGLITSTDGITASAAVTAEYKLDLSGLTGGDTVGGSSIFKALTSAAVAASIEALTFTAGDGTAAKISDYFTVTGDTTNGFTLTAKQAGAVSNEISTEFGSCDKMTNTVVGVNAGEGAPATKAKYEFTFDMDNLLSGGSIHLGGKTFTIYRGGIPASLGPNEVAIDLSTYNLGTVGSNSTEGLWGATQEIFDAFSGAFGGSFTLSGNLTAAPSATTGLQFKFTMTALTAGSGSNLGEVRYTDATGASTAAGGAGVTVTATEGKDPTQGVKGTFATKTYGVDFDRLAAGDKLDIGGITISIVTSNADPSKGEITLTDLMGTGGDALLANILEANGYASGKVEVDVAGGTITLTGTVEGGAAKDFADAVTGTCEGDSDTSGNKLTLQIGDTSDTWNQLEVSIESCKTDALGIDGANVDISTAKKAQASLDVIRNAINQVSDVRGTLGATQNRLDHTMNNLSVMTENIQDAESTIRDTDVADEMMAYTKNNILIQSAQAMLAQANQVPQGVLQLLQ